MDYFIGIDLGTTNTLAAHSIDDKNTEILINFPSQYNDIYSIKRWMGHAHDHPWYEQTKLSAIDISALYLIKIQDHIAQKMGQNVKIHAVVTIPAYFDEKARNDTKKAVQKAGINLVRLMAEPTSAALAYGLNQKMDGYYAVYDLGGGTFDFSVLRIKNQHCRVCALGGNRYLGGDDIDTLLQDYLSKTYNMVLNKDETKNLRHQLDQQSSVHIQDIVITQNEFNDLITPLIQHTIILAENTLRQALILDPQQELQGIIMAGGMSRTPLIQKMVMEKLHTNLYTNLNPDTVVVLGAALHAHQLENSMKNLHSDKQMLLIDVNPIPIGLETIDGLMEIMIPQQTPLPFQVTKTFTVQTHQQTDIILRIFQGTSILTKNCLFLREFIFNLQNTQHNEEDEVMPKIDITFDMDSDGILWISATHKHSCVIQDYQVTLPPISCEQEISASNLPIDLFLQESIGDILVKQKQTINTLETFFHSGFFQQNDKEQMDIFLKELEPMEDIESLSKSHERLDQLRQTITDIENFIVLWTETYIKNKLNERDYTAV